MSPHCKAIRAIRWLGARFGLDVQTDDFGDFAADGCSFDAITRGTSSGLRPW